MNGIRCQPFVLVLVCMAFGVFSGQVWAEDGLYLEMDLGVAVAPGMSVAGSDNDWGTVCDKIINPDEKEAGDGCQVQPPPSAWTNEMGGGSGIPAGFALGYRWGNLRAEGEYLHRTTTHDDRDSGSVVSDDVTLGKVEQELEGIEGGLDDVLSHNVFANLYYDLASDSRFTPYLGAGGGVARVSLDYFSRWKRNDNPDHIKTFEDRDLNEKLAGTTTVGAGKLSDTLLGYQVLAGVDYQVSDPFTVGLKIRWTAFGEFQGEREWDQLRSHESSVGRGDRVLYSATTSDIKFLAISFNTKYQF